MNESENKTGNEIGGEAGKPSAVPEPASPPKSSPPPAASAGQLLSSAREEWGLSVKDVAEFLNLHTATVKALEKDDYAQLPGTTFVKGYLRSYAKLLKLDEQKVMDCAGFEPEPMNRILSVETPLKYPEKERTPGNPAIWFLRIVLIVGVLAGLAWLAVTQLPGTGIGKVLSVFQSAPLSREPAPDAGAADNTGGGENQGALLERE